MINSIQCAVKQIEFGEGFLHVASVIMTVAVNPKLTQVLKNYIDVPVNCRE